MSVFGGNWISGDGKLWKLCKLWWVLEEFSFFYKKRKKKGKFYEKFEENWRNLKKIDEKLLQNWEKVKKLKKLKEKTIKNFKKEKLKENS